jgi:two-component system sensor kinase FixL
MDESRKTHVQLRQDIAVLRQRLIAQEAARLCAADTSAPPLAPAEEDPVTLRQAVEARTRKLANSEARLHALVDAAVDGIITITEHGIVESFNPAAERLFGYTAAEVLGHNVAMLMPTPSREEHDSYLARYLQTGEPRMIGRGREVIGQRKDGSTFPLELAVSEVRLDDRRLFTGIVRDLTARKHLEATVRRAEQLMLLGRLAAGVSHELRDPLNTIFLQADILAEEVQQPSPDSQVQIAESVADIKTEITRLSEIIQDYLSLARLASLQREAADLGALVQAWAQEMRESCTGQGVMLVLSGLAGLGQIACHPNTLRRALRNLMLNALEAMPDGGTLTLRGWGTPAQVHLAVCDTGSGIPADEIPSLFEPLHTTKPEGTGLGLYLVQEIVAAHSGTIEVQSTPGQGTTFTLTLPRAAAEPSCG